MPTEALISERNMPSKILVQIGQNL